MGCSGSKEPAAEPAAATPAAEPATQPAAEAAAPVAGEGETPRSAFKAGVLDAEAEKRVVELFKHWDIDATKKLELSAFTSASMQVGPHESKLLARLADMDLDKDGFITDEVRSRAPRSPAGLIHRAGTHATPRARAPRPGLRLGPLGRAQATPVVRARPLTPLPPRARAASLGRSG